MLTLTKIMMFAVMLSVLTMSMLCNVRTVNADDTIYPWDYVYKALPVITVTSPMNNSENFNSLQLTIIITKPADWLIHGGYNGRQTLEAISYQLDDTYYGPYSAFSYLESPYIYSVNLSELSAGKHSLIVYANATGWVIGNTHEYSFPIIATSNITYFTVSDNLPNTSPIVPEFTTIVTLVTILAVVSLLLVIGKRKLTIINH